MADIFGNIFEDEKEEQGGDIKISSSQTSQAPSSGGDLFGDIFGDADKSDKQVQVEQDTGSLTASTETVEKKGFFAKALNVGKKVTKWGLDVFGKQVERNKQATLEFANLQRSAPLQIALKNAKTEDERQNILNDPKYAKYKPYESYEEYQQNVPIIKFFNSEAGKKTISTISEKTSNIPLKTAARIKSIGDQTYDEAYNTYLAERNDPENPVWQKFLFELQDTGIQSGIGILLSVGTAAVTRNPQAGYAVSGAYYTALSADEQLQNKGQVDSLGNIAIDVVGDQIINRTLIGVLNKGTSAGVIRSALEGFGIEGSTEVVQSLAKYANDYANAKTQKDKDAVLAEAKQYVTSGGIAMEFAVGGTVGAIADVSVSKLSGGSSSQPNDQTTKKGGVPKDEAPRVPNTSPVQATVENADVDSAVTQLVELERSGDTSDPLVAAEITALRDILNDYTTAFNDKTIFVPSEVSSSPLVEVVTSTLPNGKVVVKYSTNTENNGFASTFDYGQLFSSQEEATKSAREAIVAWAQTQETTDVSEQAELEKIVDYAQNPRSPIREDAPTVQDVQQEQEATETMSPQESVRQASPKFLQQYVDESGFYTEGRFKNTSYAKNFVATKDTADGLIKKGDKVAIIKKGNSFTAELERPVRSEGFTYENISDINVEDFVLQEKETTSKKPVKSTQKGDKKPLVEQDEQVKKPSTEPQKKKQPTKKRKATTSKKATRTPVTEVAGEKISQRTAKTIYAKGVKVGKGTYNGKPYSTNTFVLEFSDVDGITVKNTPEEMPDSDGIQIVVDRIGGKKLSAIKRIISPENGKTAVVFGIEGGEVAVDVEFYNYLAKKYPTASWVGDEQTPIGLYENEELVAMVMPMANTAGKVLENFEKPVSTPSGLAQMVYSEADLTEGGQPETEAATVPIKQGQLDSINPIEMPELVELAREIMGNVPQVTKLRGGKGGGQKLGDFLPKAGGRIRLQEFLFQQKNLPQAAKVLAHEMGHLIDYLPDQNIKRGNILGRIGTLRGFMQETFSFKQGKGLSEKQLNDLRKEARKEIAKKKGKAQKDFTLADKRAATNLYKKKLEQTLKSGGFIENAKIKQELLTITRWWHPYDPAKVPASYNQYRESSVELYAEAISVLFNAPRRLQDMAPTFYSAFFEGIDAKPEVRDAYFELQALLSGDREVLVRKRREGVKRMFKEGDYKAIDLHNRRVAEKEQQRKQYWSHFKHTVIDKNYQIIDRVAKARKEGKTINPDENPEFFLEERNYIGGKIKALFEREFNTIYSTLNENEIAWGDFGELLFYERIAAGDRSDVANPRGITPDAAKELIDTMKKEYGAERWAIMQEQVEKFRAANKKVVEDAFEAGLYKPELYKQMQENPAYVTFQVLDHLEEGMTSRVYKSLGTLKDVTNPADATMLKVITTIRAAERNKVAKSTVDFLKENFAGEIVEANYSSSPKGRFPMPSKKPDQELVTFFEEGKIKGYYVDPYIAETINNQSVGRNAPIIPVIRFMNSTLFRPLFISFNLGFQSFNLIRDFVRFYKNTPNMSFLRAMKRYGQAGRISRVRAFGLPKNPSVKDVEAFNLLNKMEEEQVLSTTFNDIISGRSEVDKQVEKILAETGIKDFQPKPTIERVPRFAKPVVKALDKAGILSVTSNMLGFIENLGNLIETLPKAAGVYELSQDGELSREDKSFIRRKIGSPDFLAGGTYKPVTNEVFLFSNAIIQGIRSDIEVATDPKTRSGWWWKTAKIVLIPKLLMMAVLYGAFGDEYKELMEGASEYDRTNYTIIPLGRDSNGKPIYVRVPVDETSRFLGGIFWKALTVAKNEKSIGADIMDVASYTGGQIPSISPAIESISATAQFLSGRNPYDFFRGRPALSETTFKAGGLPATKAFLGWQFQQLGGGIFYRFYHEPSAQRDEGAVEKFFNAPVIGNVLGRFVRVSDYGEVEQLKGIEARVEKEKAKETLQERQIINKYIKEARDQGLEKTTSKLENDLIKEVYDGMPSTKDELAEAKRLVKKFRLSLQRGNADPNVTALVDASSNDVKLEILKKIESEMSNEEFSKLRRQLIDGGIVAGEVFNELLRQ